MSKPLRALSRGITRAGKSARKAPASWLQDYIRASVGYMVELTNGDKTKLVNTKLSLRGRSGNICDHSSSSFLCCMQSAAVSVAVAKASWNINTN